MARPDPALLDPARYRFSCDVPTRFGDLDINMHVNNAALVMIIEESRVRFHAACGFALNRQDWSAMVASTAIEYLAQTHYPQPVTVHGALLSLGRTSFSLAQLACQADGPVAYCQTVMVCVRDGASCPLPEDFVSRAKDWMFRT